MANRTLILFFAHWHFLVYCNSLFCQSVSTSILSAHVKEWLESDYVGDLLSADQLKIRGSLFNRFQLRTETNNFQFDRQEYALRFGGTSMANLKRIQQFSSHWAALHEWEASLLLLQRLYAAYKGILDLAYVESSIAAYNEFVTVLENNFLFIKSSLESGQIKLVDDFVDVLTERQTIQDKLTILEMQKKALMSDFKLDPTDTFLSMDNLVELFSPVAESRIRESLQNVEMHPAHQMAKSRASIAKVEDEISIANQRRVFQFVQLRYRNDPQDFVRERLDIGLALNIPFTHPERYKHKLASFEQLIAQKKIEHNLTSKMNNLAKLYRKWERTKAEYVKKERRLTTIANDLDAIMGILSQSNEWSSILKLKLHIHKTKIELISDLKLIYETYIEMLYESGALIAKPRINLLLEGEEEY